MDSVSISVIIPTWQAALYLPTLIPQLHSQTLAPSEIIIIDSSSPDGTAALARDLGCKVEVIPQNDFNHGDTRNRAARLASGDVLVFMTQDALPVDNQFLAELTRPLLEKRAAAAYARQIAADDASPLEKFNRAFNYAPISHQKTNADLPRMGIKTYFFSDTASAVRRDDFWSVGGYPAEVIVNEDMILCARLLQAGHTIAYQAAAQVYHSHASSLSKLFQRYFDIGVFMRQSQDVLVGAKSGGEGLRFALAQLRYLVEQRQWGWIPRSLVESPLKLVAFHVGKRSRYLPIWLNRRLSGQKAFWLKENSTKLS